MELKKRPRNRAVGLAILAASVSIFFVYAYFLIFSGFSLMIMEATMLAAVAVLLTVFGWIGYAMLTAPRAEKV